MEAKNISTRVSTNPNVRANPMRYCSSLHIESHRNITKFAPSANLCNMRLEIDRNFCEILHVDDEYIILTAAAVCDVAMLLRW